MCTLRYMPDIRLHLSDETQARLDEERGSVPRVRWIRDLIEERLGNGPVRVPEPPPSKPLPPIQHHEPIDEHREFLEGGTAAQDRAVRHNAKVKKEQPVKTKECQHLHTRYRMGRKHCTDCGDLL
jgi:hypothetical protein